MKKSIKRVSQLLLVGLMVLSMSLASFAADGELGSEGVLGPTELFINTYTDLFEQRKPCHVIDNAGNDITASFVSTYESAYNSGDFESIWRYVRDNVDVIMWSNPVQTKQTRADISSTASQTYYKLGTTQSRPQTTFEMRYTVSGNYKYHDSNGEISYYSDANVNIDAFTLGAAYAYKQVNTSTSARLANNKKSVTFSAQFSVEVSYTPYGFYLWTETFGPYSGSATGTSY